MVIYRKTTLDVEWMDLHDSDFDLIALLFAAL
jgi:hypothetical protein